MKKKTANLKEKTDRELAEIQTKVLIDIVNNQINIKNNVAFFFWLIIISLGISLVALIVANS